MIKISTSILSSKNRIDTIKKLNDTPTDYIHIDVMDGYFVTNKQFQIDEINSLLPQSKKPIDIHLMVENPEKYIKELNNPIIEYITFHLETKQNINNLITLIKNKGYKVGIAIKPNTNINKIYKYIDKIDMILIMSVEPGYGGQTFINKTYKKINTLKKKNNNITIEVDGGINDTNIEKLKNNIDIAVIGSYIINKDDYKKTIIELKK